MFLSDVLQQIRKIPKLVDGARMALDKSDPSYIKMRNVYNQVAVAFKLPRVAEGSMADTTAQIVANLGGAVGKFKSKSRALNRAVVEVAAIGQIDESLHDSVERNRDDPTLIGKEKYFSRISGEIREELMDEKNLDIADISHKVHFLRRDTNINAVNGGTIDVRSVYGSSGTTSGSCYASQAATTYQGALVCAGGARVQLSSANAVESVWAKMNSGKRESAIVMYHDGVNDFASNPSIRIIIPAGVPSGYLDIHGSRVEIGQLYVDNVGAGAGITVEGSMDTVGATLAVKEGASTLWTWADGAGNEDYRHHRKVNKGTNDEQTITLTLTLSASASVAFTSLVSAEFHPDDVSLEDMLDLNVGIDVNDPLNLGIECQLRYSAYLDRLGSSGFIDILNGRLGTSYNSDVIYPTNWNTTSFENKNDFIDTYVYVWNLLREAMLRDVGFLEES